ncbi:MAG: hypothetical protein RIR70_1666 [Pseudomonadota bacterium]|jgi:uncharacterized alpha-E superfamily protein
MARYTERAENLARMLDITHRMSLMPTAAVRGDDAAGWEAALAINGQQAAYAAKYGVVEESRVMRFLCFDADNPSSIWRCLRQARENAHAVRGTLTGEVWETLNASWIKLRDAGPAVIENGRAGEFFDWVKFRSHLSRGVMLGTMLRDEGLWFARLGTFMERADFTARLLDVKYHQLLPAVEDIGSASDYYQWSALLRSVSCFEMYRKIYRDLITPWRVSELLILRDDMPRSLHHCMNEVCENLDKLANRSSSETERRAGELHALLHYGRMESIFEEGLHEFLSRFTARIADLADRIADDFLIPKLH